MCSLKQLASCALLFVLTSAAETASREPLPVRQADVPGLPLIEEVEVNASAPVDKKLPRHNKLVLVIFEVMALGIFGVDRCYMGNLCCGVVKCFTVGGFGIWASVDFLVIFINSLQRKKDIDYLGFEADWDPEDIEPAFIAAILGIALLVLQLIAGLVNSLCGERQSGRKHGNDESELEGSDSDEDS
eukprot:TRINITY_DN6908_c0_g2_i1.p1 TRINITY_DN6908_c0_g2~~TRINITY_DN6908_c0_g2_i1.p1  ORF type:complete len:187 (+),score=28.92 TRINITY_DN6908_c0_g2_i1:77-637(+)